MHRPDESPSWLSNAKWMPPYKRETAASSEWDTLSEAEKRAHIDFMHSLTLDPPLSRVLIENRR